MRLLAASVGPLRHVRSVPGGDLVTPAQQRPAERTDLDRAGLVLEIVAETRPRRRRPGRDRCARRGWRTTSLACQAMRTSPAGIAGVEQTEEPAAAVVVETFIGLRQQPPAAGRAGRPCGPDARSSRSAPAAGTHRAWVGQLHDVERVSDLDGVGQHRVEHRPIRTATDPTSPTRCWRATPRAVRRTSGTARPLSRPATTSSSCPASTSTIDVDHRWRRGGRRARTTSRPTPTPSTVPIPVGVVDERRAVGDHGVVHGVPVAAQLEGDLVHGATVAADLDRHPPRRPDRSTPTEARRSPR